MKKPRLLFNSPAVLGFAGICFVALILNWITGGLTNKLLFSTYRAPLTNPLTWFRFFGHVFGHSDWKHFTSNMTLILVIGPLLEEKYGTKNLIMVMMSTAFVTGFIYFLFFPTIALLGASGIAYAFVLMASFGSFREDTVPVTFLLVAVIYIGQEVWNMVFHVDNVANLAHIIGELMGAGFGFFIARRNKDEL